jgi:hypothetical protein
MNAVDRLLATMRRVWMLERSLRTALLAVSVALVVALLCLVLNLLFGLSLVSLAFVAGSAFVALAAVAVVVRLQAPRGTALARILDARLETQDLFASALEFGAEPDRFGWLGALTCEKAREQALQLAVKPRWPFGPARRWTGIGTAAGTLTALYVVVLAVQRLPSSGTRPDPTRASPMEMAGPDAREERAVAEPEPDETVMPMEEVSETAKPTDPKDDTVRITTEMIDRYLQQMPQAQEIDLEGVTPIRWDKSEVSANRDLQERDYQEKIDPVKLDADMLKDVQAAKKTEDKGGEKKGAVDVAVIGKAEGGKKARGKSGGESKEGSLADAVSNDPRGKPTRVAKPPPRRGLRILSAARTGSKQTGEIRPMGLLDFLTAMRLAQAEATDPAPVAGPRAVAAHGTPRPIPADTVPDEAVETASRYFSRLRDADR